MKGKRLSAIIILLGVVLCFVSVVGHGEILHQLDEVKATKMDFFLLTAKVSYMMSNPADFLNVSFYYDASGKAWKHEFPELDTGAKVFILVVDDPQWYAYETPAGRLRLFEEDLKIIYSFIDQIATNMDTDIIAKLYGGTGIPLAYFYEGEYYSLEE